jgi:hypothetical protein
MNDRVPIFLKNISHIKEHMLISVFANANAGATFGNCGGYTLSPIIIIKTFYKRNILFVTSLLRIITTPVLGYGLQSLVQVSS